MHNIHLIPYYLGSISPTPSIIIYFVWFLVLGTHQDAKEVFVFVCSGMPPSSVQGTINGTEIDLWLWSLKLQASFVAFSPHTFSDFWGHTW